MSGYTSYRWWRPPLNEGPGYSEDEERLDLAVRNNVESALSAAASTLRAPAPRIRGAVRRRVVRGATQSFAEYLTYYAGGKDMAFAHGALGGSVHVEAVDVRNTPRRLARDGPDVIKPGPSAEQVSSRRASR
jgi:hypothetical protein